ncbi:BMP family ABC transporter substrate-binding protein [Paenibacillus sp.]|uniref:BMP family lipoprotein n=1 Tax=Paenibacillus sp. TaxID=58172 RepID=UPI002D674C16|nr:BMP family ABC transporter substrate-binding protein [Paenibacillus sp.]HZG56621.1 BMP family ABC transporter substrate-binding protein [Paenibacillus sp.]
MMKKWMTLGASLVLVTSVLAACGGAKTDESGGEAKANIAVVFATGGLGDKSFNDNGYAGIERAKSELGITYDYVEPQEVSEFETHHREFAKTNEYDLIVGIGFDQVDAIGKVSGEFPDQKFVLIDSVVEAPNVASAVTKDNEGAFLAGALAAKKSESKKIGIVGGMDIPLINAFVAGYTAGAKYAEPSTEVLVNYVGAWNDPNLGKEMAVSMYDGGADIVYAAAGGSGLGVFTAAEEKGKLAIGADMVPSQMPDILVTTTVKRIDNIIFDNVKAIVDGTWTAGVQSLGVADEAVGYSVEGSNIETAKEIIDYVEDLKAKIVSGELAVPADLASVDAFLASNK